jgi:carboxyl-terminal processing protease
VLKEVTHGTHCDLSLSDARVTPRPLIAASARLADNFRENCMNRKLWWLALAFAATVQAATPDAGLPPIPDLRPLQQQPVAAHLTARLLERNHYKAVPLDNVLSEKIFDHYLKSLDAEKLFFLQSDIDQWSDSRSRLDDAILNDDLDIPFAMFNRYTRRAVERYTYARTLLKAGFDFQQKESYQYLREKEAWPKNDDEVRELWRKRVKSDWLQLKIAGKDNKAIVTTLDKRYENFIKRIGKLKSEDAFQIFMNAYTTSVEPHTSYMGPRATEDFDISMRLSLIGIGAVLEDKDDYTTIKELVPGGPAALSGKLKVGDRILGVAQGDKAAMADVVGWRLDDTVALIRGAADSTVILDILPVGVGPDAEHKLISLVRKKISLEEQAAKKSVLVLSDGVAQHRIGVISLPTFYEDFEARQKGERDFKSATRDVSRLLNELKSEKVDGVLIDLRNNGGGSLTEAIELTGLFVGGGPVVQQRDAQGRISVARDTTRAAVWTGPLGVLINRGSASASEIFAAAIQDYRRGVVIGEPSFGKGTVQTLVNLDQMVRSEKQQLGELRLTIAQFFRIDGTTTQLRGVTPDINLPAISDPEHFGESSFDNALPWMRIRAADYQTLGDLHDLLPTLKQRHDVRVAKDKDYQYLVDDIAEYNVRRKKNQISLNEVERRKERDAQDAKLKLRDKGSATDKKSSAKPAENTPTASAPASEDDEDEFDKRRKNAKDALLNEAAHILGDQAELLTARPDLASRPAGKSLKAPGENL